jgi:hypothetical protein
MKNDLQRTTIFLTKDQHEKLRTLAFKKKKIYGAVNKRGCN